MNGGFFVEFSSGKCIGFVGVSGAIFCLTFQRFWRVGEDDTPSKKNPIYRPITAELSLETIRNSKMIYVLPSQGFRFLLHHCGCVTVKLRGVEAVAPVHMDRKLEHYDPRDTAPLHTVRSSEATVMVFLHDFPSSHPRPTILREHAALRRHAGPPLLLPSPPGKNKAREGIKERQMENTWPAPLSLHPFSLFVKCGD